jgi:uncharacterized membrane protein
MNVIAQASLQEALAEVQVRPADRRAYRMAAIDILRGLVIVVMALDHARDYMLVGSTQDPTTDAATGPLLFATRWITHFCAPTFVFLSGVSAGLMAHRKSRSELARFLLSRGLWLILLEVVVISTATSFAPTGVPELGDRTYVGLQVIWAIGASMVVLAGAQYLGMGGCTVVGAAIILGHNLLDTVWPTGAAQAPLWTVLHSRQTYQIGAFSIFFSYPLLPWIGVMLLGYGSARLFEGPAGKREQRLHWIGVGLLLAFLMVRWLDIYGDPRHWHVDSQHATATVMAFLATTKYPPSLLYLLMTLGGAAIICAYADRLPDAPRHVLQTFGRAPLAFYVAHLYVLHTAAIVLGLTQGFRAQQFLTAWRYFPKGYGLSLSGVYVMWIAVVAMLYPLCRWMASLKARRTDWWLSYL